MKSAAKSGVAYFPFPLGKLKARQHTGKAAGFNHNYTVTKRTTNASARAIIQLRR
jgi:hypothetical protein